MAEHPRCGPRAPQSAVHVAVDITPVTWPGRSGVACVAANLARALARRAPQHDFTMIAPRPLNPAYGADLEPVVLGGGFAGYWSLGLPRFIRTTKCDALIVTSRAGECWNQRTGSSKLKPVFG
jgi:hypothetical protein